MLKLYVGTIKENKRTKAKIKESVIVAESNPLEIHKIQVGFVTRNSKILANTRTKLITLRRLTSGTHGFKQPIEQEKKTF